MASLLAFIRLSRLQFLTGGILGVAFGAAIARHQGFVLSWQTLLLVQVAVTAFQLMTHYTNDYFDRDADVLAARTPFSGGSGVLANNELAPAVAIAAATICMCAGASIVAVLAVQHKPAAATIGVLIALLAYSYSSPPLRLLARGLGELATALVVGVLVPLFSYAAFAQYIDAVAFYSTIPAGLAMFVMMICVEIPDIAADAAGGKRNLLVRFGGKSAPVFISFATTGMALGMFVAVHAGAPRAMFPVAVLGMILCTWLRVNLQRDPPRPAAWIARTGVAIFVLTLAAGVAAYLV
jgi:1,4-dihydroxy-2-naphthoate octaprenyltransferase